MIKSDLVEYIRKELSMGTNRDTLLISLKAGGWNEQDINDSFLEFDKISKGEKNTGLFVRNIKDPHTRSHIIGTTVRSIFLLVITFLIIAYILGGEV